MSRRPGSLFETAAALGALAGTWLLFHVRGQRAVSASVRRAMGVQASTVEELAASRWDVWVTTRALRRAERVWPLRVACLQRSLALQSLLSRHDVAGRLRVGSRIEDGDLAAHAWVEVGDYVLDGHGARPDFAPFPAPGTRGAPEVMPRDEEGPTP